MDLCQEGTDDTCQEVGHDMRYQCQEVTLDIRQEAGHDMMRACVLGRDS